MYYLYYIYTNIITVLHDHCCECLYREKNKLIKNNVDELLKKITETEKKIDYLINLLEKKDNCIIIKKDYKFIRDL